MQTIKPARNQVFAKPVKASAQTKSGLFIPGSEQIDTQQAEIIDIGAGVDDYKKGDVIIYKEYMPTEIELDKVKYIIIAQVDVLGKVVEE